VPTRVNEYGFEDHGMEIAAVHRAALPCALLYRYYFRVQTQGIERIPRGRVLLISNHADSSPSTP